MKINFITNQDINITSGGWSGINFNINKQLIKYLDVNYIGPINPKMIFYQKLISKIYRVFGIKGNFSFFSNKRLANIEKQVADSLDDDVTYNFYFGQTPWLKCKYDVPYGVYLDADFQTYLRIFSKIDSFNESDITRIAKEEEKWLQGAKDIFIGSEWAWREMLKFYDLREEQKVVVHTGGNIDLPQKDEYKGGLNLVFISLNFEKKGGFICVEAFRKVKEKHPKLTLTIIGEKPPNDILSIDGVIYAGLLRKTDEDELAMFKSILSDAFLLIHPTKMDTMGAVLIEAGYFGCPSIAPRSFGVPELVLNEETGFIVDVPFEANDFAEKIESLILNKHFYDKMRLNAWTYTRTQLTWDSIGNKIKNHIEL